MFSLYLPGPGPATEAALRQVGADWALDSSVTPMFVGIDEGPDGVCGRLVYFEQRGRFSSKHLAAVDLQAQRWEPAAPEGDLPAARYWIGVWKDGAANPEDLQRANMVDGVPVELRGGQQWVIPIVDYLPQSVKLNRQTGEEELRPLPEHLSFVEKTNALFRYLIGDEFQERVAETFKVLIPKGLSYAAEALAMNYRVNRDLVDMLDLIGEYEAAEIATITTGLKLAETVDQKKSLFLAERSSAG